MVAADRRPPGVTAFFVLMGELFVAGRLEEMSGFWSFPCPIEIDGRLVVMRDREALLAYLSARRSDWLALGLTAMAPRISAIEMPRKGRFRVWLRWVFHFGDRVVEEDHGTLYFMARTAEGRLTIEMMDAVQLPSATVAQIA